MAYGTPATDALTPPPLIEGELNDCFADVPFGISKGSLIPDDVVDKINASEAGAVKQRRLNLDVMAKPDMNAVGLGLSGGGIRSATFCLGVTQVLAKRNLLKDVDFLSTVSGGGYVGCFLTTRLKGKESHTSVAGPHGPDSAAVRYLRQHAKYLTAIDLWERWSMVTSTIAGMLLNWTAPLFLIALAALFGVYVAQFGRTHRFRRFLPARSV
jgi:predicted acylesterase/phospholipase RssA